MIRKNYDKILLGVALVVLLVVFVFSAFRPEVRPITDFVDIPRLHEGNTFQVSPPPEVEIQLVEWERPGPQSAGPHWLYDVFTPPEIFYNAITQEFTVIPPGGPVEEDDFGIGLVDIREELYRVQLLGYVGRQGDFLINLENVETGELVLAREGREYPELGITVRSFKVERQQVRHEGRTDVFEEVARIVIFDHRLERELELRSDTRLRDDRPTAIFRRTGDSGDEIRAHEGDSFDVGEYNFLVESIDPPVATVVRTSRENPEERQTEALTVSRPTQRAVPEDEADVPEESAAPSPPASEESAPRQARPRAGQPREG